MRLLLDEQLPHDLAPLLAGHEVQTVAQLGWAGLKNGELLRRAAKAGIEVLVTMDRNLEHQQNLRASPLGFLLPQAKTTRLEDLVALVPAALSALPGCRPGSMVRVGS